MPNSKTVILFPGLDALFVTQKLKFWIEVPSIQEKLKEASEYLSFQTQQKEDLLEFVKNNRRLHIVDFDRTLIVLTTLQVAIAQLLPNKEQWDIVQGCSHGDIARNVITDIITFKDAVEILWTFAELRKNCPDGYTASVRSTDGEKLTQKQKNWLEFKGANFSSWSESHGTVGGDSLFIGSLSSEGVEQGLKIKPILSYPVHSKAMEPIIDQMLSYKHKWQFKDPKMNIFSSIWLKPITSGESAFEEGIAGALQPVLWLETLKHLKNNENVNKFINIGPSNTLTGWLLDSPEFQDVRVLEATEIIFNEVESESSRC